MEKLSLLQLPSVAENGLVKLRELCDEHPVFLPLPKVAGFLGADPEGLRCAIEQGRCPFGVSWHKSIQGNKAFKIPTVTFFLWYTNGAGYKENRE